MSSQLITKENTETENYEELCVNGKDGELVVVGYINRDTVII